MVQLHKNGFMEAVIFVFYRNGKILVEKRPKGKDTVVSIPSGAAEREDMEHGDYMTNAALREISEEMQGLIIPLEYEYLTSYKAMDRKINFHAFLITKWKGKMPAFTIEGGKKFSDLKWIKLSEYRKHLAFPSNIKICELLLRRVGKN